MPVSAATVDTVITHASRSNLPDSFDPIEISQTLDDARSPFPVIEAEPNEYVPIRKARRLRKLAVFMLLILAFGGALYGTGVYIRSTNLWANVWSAFRKQTATANTDINLRAEPNANSDQIGLVTKNSKVRIVNSQNNWYQVDVIQQGRDRTGSPNATRGWLNGKYLDIDDN